MQQKLGGGISQEYELIDRFVIGDTPIGKQKRWLVDADDILINAIDVKGTNGGTLAFQVFVSSSSSMMKVYRNFLSDTTAKSQSILFERVTPSTFKQIQNNETALKKVSLQDIDYSTKLGNVLVGTTDNNNQILEGTIEIYGRKRM